MNDDSKKLITVGPNYFELASEMREAFALSLVALAIANIEEARFSCHTGEGRNVYNEGWIIVEFTFLNSQLGGYIPRECGIFLSRGGVREVSSLMEPLNCGGYCVEIIDAFEEWGGRQI